MKKSTVFLISGILLISFIALVVYGFKRPGGIPVVIKEPKKDFLNVPFSDTDIDFSKGIDLGMWDAHESKELELIYQLMVLPWGKSLVSPITVKSFHNEKDIYFYISWKDKTEDKNLNLDKFSDAAAIMFPMNDKAASSTVMMGFLGGANIWYWKASQDREFWFKESQKSNKYVDFYYPFEEEELFVVSNKGAPTTAVNDLMAIRVGTITPKETQNVQGRGVWIDGTWHVVIRRSFKSLDDEVDAVFEVGKRRLCAFAIWDGSNNDRGGRKSISGLVELNIKQSGQQ